MASLLINELLEPDEGERYRIYPSTRNRMAKVWQGERTADAGQYHGGHPMGGGFIDSPYSAPPPIPSGHPTLDPGVAYFVRVCGFNQLNAKSITSMIQAFASHQRDLAGQILR